MKKYFFNFFVSLFLQYSVFGQLNFDISKVKGKSKIYFKHHRHGSKDSIFQPISIFHSKHKYEISLSALYGPNGGFADYTLYSDGNEWNAYKWESSFLDLYDTTKTKYKKLKTNNWDTIVNKLQNLDIFILPNQIKLEKEKKKECLVFDGAMYSITFKINNKFRRYSFDNPSTCSENFKDIIEFKKYKEIVDVFYESFKE